MEKKIPEIDVIYLNNNIPLLKRATKGSAGFDLHANIDRTLIIPPGEVRLVPTGLKIHIKDKNIVGLIFPRSKKGHQNGLVLGNLTGVIDSDYQGEWFISVWNRNPIDSGIYLEIEPFDAIAQVVFTQLPEFQFNIIDNFSFQTGRNDGGISKTVDS